MRDKVFLILSFVTCMPLLAIHSLEGVKQQSFFSSTMKDQSKTTIITFDQDG